MIGGIKQSIEKHFSLLNRLNPSALISDALYALNIYDDYKIFLQKSPLWQEWQSFFV